MKYCLLPIGITLLATIACTPSVRKEISETVFPDSLYTVLREGDLAFRRGYGIASQMVLIAGKGGAYSHIGIVSKNNKEKWYVIHAVPGECEQDEKQDRIQMTPIEHFFSPEKAVSGAIMRVACSDSIARQATTYAVRHYQLRTPFDHNYQLSDTTAFYCTELIAWAYQRTNIDLIEDRMHPVEIPGFSGNYIFPSDIQQSDKLTLLYAY